VLTNKGKANIERAIVLLFVNDMKASSCAI
jgi:hypothetical protein